MSAVMHKVGAFAARRAPWVVAAWVVIAIALVVIANSAGRPENDNVTLPGTGSQAATDLLAVQILPGADGARFDVELQSIDSQRGKLLSDQSATFSMSTATNVRNVPLQMQSGLIDGDLAAPGMQMAYWFLSPAIE